MVEKERLETEVKDSAVLDKNEPVNNEVNKTEKGKEKKKIHIPQPIKYAICTASAGLIEFITFTILTFAMKNVEGDVNFIEVIPLNSFVPTIIALALSVLWNFTINRKFTFKSAGNVPRAMFLAFLFYVPFFPFKVWFNGTVPMQLVASGWDLEGAKFFIEVCSMLINGVLEFCWQKFVIYRKEENTAVEKK